MAGRSSSYRYRYVPCTSHVQVLRISAGVGAHVRSGCGSGAYPVMTSELLRASCWTSAVRGRPPYRTPCSVAASVLPPRWHVADCHAANSGTGRCVGTAPGTRRCTGLSTSCPLRRHRRGGRRRVLQTCRAPGVFRAAERPRGHLEAGQLCRAVARPRRRRSGQHVGRRAPGNFGGCPQREWEAIGEQTLELKLPRHRYVHRHLDSQPFHATDDPHRGDICRGCAAGAPVGVVRLVPLHTADRKCPAQRGFKVSALPCRFG